MEATTQTSVQWQDLEATIRSSFDAAAAGLGVVDLNGRYVEVNDALCRILGSGSSAVLGHHPDEFIREMHGDTTAAQIARALSTEDDVPLGGEALVARPDGTSVWVLASVAIVRGSQREPLYFFVQLQDITQLKVAEESARDARGRLRRTLDELVLAVAHTVELRDPYTAGHQERVARLAVVIAGRLGLDADTIEGIEVGATIHDIGKIAIPAEILGRPGKLSPAEFELIKAHPQAGRDIVAGVEFPWPVARMILEHHERMDGSGYPNALAGDDILLESRIIAVADVLEAVSAHRPYRPALGMDCATDVIERGRGVLFDADVVDASLQVAPSLLADMTAAG